MKILFAAILVVLTGNPAQAAECKEHRLVAQESPEALKKSFTELKAQFKSSKDEDLQRFFESDDLGHGGKLFRADVNNDGKPDLTFTYMDGGSAGYISVMVFSKNGEKYDFVGEPPKPKSETSDGPWYFYLHLDPKTKNTEFLVDECGKTFMQFDTGGEEGRPRKLEKFLWANGETKPVGVKKMH